MFAVIKTGGKQYKVAANDVLKIEKLTAEPGEVVTFDQVLMVGDDAGTTLGAPVVEGALVAAELVETRKQKTIIVFKKKRRHNYRRRNGHRQLLSTVRITEILTGGAQPSVRSTPALAAAAPEQSVSEAPAATENPIDAAVAASNAAAVTEAATPKARASRKAAPRAETETAEPTTEAAAKPARTRKSAPKADQE